MIIAAAACAAAGISYIFHDDEQSIKTKDEIVTASSTIIDKQGIVKYVIHPRLVNPYVFISQPFSMRNQSISNQLEVPMENNKEKNDFKQEFSVVFFWSIPLKARLLEIPTKSCVVMENLNPFQRHLMKISIGTQNGINENSPSEIALSNSNETFDSLAYNPIVNDHVIPIGILKKQKLDINEKENNQKRFCLNKNSNEEQPMRTMILQNVNYCVENILKILSESCSNTEEQFTALHNSSSLISAINNNEPTQAISKNRHSKHEDHFTAVDLYNENNDRERLSDGIILHRGQQFGIALGEPMIRKWDENLSRTSSHSINELNRLLSKTNCLLMREHLIESIEDLIQLFLKQGQDQFTELLIHLFKVEPLIVEQLNIILLKWAKQLT